MASWITPKTNWTSFDFFNASDYNRIVGNLLYLHEQAEELFIAFDIQGMVDEKNYYSMIYASEFNKIEQNLETINLHTYNTDIGTTKEYLPNGLTPDYNELNRIEEAEEKFFQNIYGQLCAIQHYAYNLGRLKMGKRTRYDHSEVIAYRGKWELGKGKGVF